MSIYCATGGVFSRPTVIGTARKIFLPSYDEWSLAIENQIARNTVLAVQYVGNRSYHQPVQSMPNAFWSPNGGPGSNASLPTARPNAALGSVTEFSSSSSSNFNGLQATLTSRLNWLTMQFNYTYGHALDTTSNGGFNAFGINANGQINASDLRQNYGNADYDVRHYVSANYSIRVPYWGGPRVLTDGWQIAGTVFHNSGYPFSVTDDTGQVAYGSVPLAKQIDNNFNHHCGGGSHAGTPCSFASHFTNSTDYGSRAATSSLGELHRLRHGHLEELPRSSQMGNGKAESRRAVLQYLQPRELPDSAERRQLVGTRNHQCSSQHTNFSAGGLPRWRCLAEVDPAQGKLRLLT